MTTYKLYPFEVEIHESYGELGGRYISYLYPTIDELREKIANLSNNEKIIHIKEYYLVYMHSALLPPCTRVDEFTHHEVYSDWVRIPKEHIKTAKQKDYKDKFNEDSSYNNYCLSYITLTKHEYLDYIYPINSTYDLKNHSRKDIMAALYQHSRSTCTFNLELYQYRYLTKEEVLN